MSIDEMTTMWSRLAYLNGDIRDSPEIQGMIKVYDALAAIDDFRHLKHSDDSDPPTPPCEPETLAVNADLASHIDDEDDCHEMIDMNEDYETPGESSSRSSPTASAASEETLPDATPQEQEDNPALARSHSPGSPASGPSSRRLRSAKRKRSTEDDVQDQASIFDVRKRSRVTGPSTTIESSVQRDDLPRSPARKTRNSDARPLYAQREPMDHSKQLDDIVGDLLNHCEYHLLADHVDYVNAKHTSKIPLRPLTQESDIDVEAYKPLLPLLRNVTYELCPSMGKEAPSRQTLSLLDRIFTHLGSFISDDERSTDLSARSQTKQESIARIKSGIMNMHYFTQERILDWCPEEDKKDKEEDEEEDEEEENEN